jgi:signal transduction histidine kinase
MDLTAVLESMVDAVFVCDATGKLVATNRAGLRLVHAEDFRQLTARNFHLPDVRDEDGCLLPTDCLPLQRALTGEEVVHQVEILGVDPAVVLRTRSAPIRDDAGAIVGAVKVCTDVTREYQLERLKEEFIQTAAHELKTPIAAIKSTAEAALAGAPELSGSVRQLLEGLCRGVDRIDRLIGSLLDLVELQGGLLSLSRTPVELDALIAELVRRLPRSSAQRTRITASQPVQVKGDPRRLRQALQSLLDNAVKYSPRGTPVEIALSRRDRLAHVSILDRGVGIPPEQRERVFEKFFRAHSGTSHDAGGIGVGLFIAREIITQHGGRIWLDGAEPHGTQANVELPIEERA